MPFLLANYNVKSLQVFGSYIRKEQKKGSDLDILVEFSQPIDLFKFIELEAYLSKLLGIKVDLDLAFIFRPRVIAGSGPALPALVRLAEIRLMQ